MKTLPLILIFILQLQNPSFSQTQAWPKKFSVKQVPELSGSVLIQDTLWTIGDGGHPASLGETRFSPDGKFEHKLHRLPQLHNQDWEALLADSQDMLWILDCGDNDRQREKIFLYRIDPNSLELLRRMEVIYPTGPHNCEAGFIWEDKLYLIEKTPDLLKKKSAQVYSVHLSPGQSDIQVAQIELRIPKLHQITDAAINRLGDLYLLTYEGLYQILAWRTGPAQIRRRWRGFLGQQEALFIHSDHELWVGTEEGQFTKVIP